MKPFLQYFADVIADELFIGASVDDLQKEIQQNMWLLSKPAGYGESVQDWLDLINRIIENRKQQIAVSRHSMIFYLWLDEQACQLRFNLINDSHEFLPFNSNVELVQSFYKIVEAFLTSPYHNGIPFGELDDMPLNETTDNSSLRTQLLQVYKVHLNAE
jgi:hypothetical protein